MELDSTFIATVGGGFFIGVLIGYALKKVIKLVSIIVGLFFAGLAYLVSHSGVGEYKKRTCVIPFKKCIKSSTIKSDRTVMSFVYLLI
jgi:uncharacterized membrane protein (Fun14 family)